MSVNYHPLGLFAFFWEFFYVWEFVLQISCLEIGPTFENCVLVVHKLGPLYIFVF